jgi:tRNA/rRNA methyltransferase
LREKAPNGTNVRHFQTSVKKCLVIYWELSITPSSHYNHLLASPSQLAASIDVVLVSPRNPLNIGAAARAMANFGLTRLSVVTPYAEGWREARSAVGAPDVLQNAKSTECLSEAVANCTLVLGTGSLEYRKPEQPILALPELSPLVARELQSGGHVALVFGPEKHGLSRDELSLCHAIAVIPTDARQPSMNLGQAVAVCLYELAGRGIPNDLPASTQPGNASSASLELLAAVIEETMTAARYSPEGMKTANRHDLRLLLRRLGLREREVRRILGLFRRILWALRRLTRNE